MQTTLSRSGMVKALFFMIFHPTLNGPYKIKTQNGVTIGTFDGYTTLSSFPFNATSTTFDFRVYDIQDHELFLLPYAVNDETAVANIFVQLE